MGAIVGLFAQILYAQRRLIAGTRRCHIGGPRRCALRAIRRRSFATCRADHRDDCECRYLGRHLADMSGVRLEFLAEQPQGLSCQLFRCNCVRRVRVSPSYHAPYPRRRPIRRHWYIVSQTVLSRAASLTRRPADRSAMRRLKNGRGLPEVATDSRACRLRRMERTPSTQRMRRVRTRRACCRLRPVLPHASR